MKCTIDECGRDAIARGWCHRHYKRWQVSGSPFVARPKAASGDGNIRPDGYLEIQKGGQRHFDHVRVVEGVLGKAIPPGAKVHHVNRNRSDNRPSNLVLCQDDAHHRLIHNRMSAVENGYPPHFRKCPYCKTYDDPVNLYVNGTMNRHVACIKAYDKARYERKNP